ncbi:MAG TPA: hypothetical protein VF556_02160 [Pyrinomonadaceae bacterium]
MSIYLTCFDIWLQNQAPTHLVENNEFELMKDAVADETRRKCACPVAFRRLREVNTWIVKDG